MSFFSKFGLSLNEANGAVRFGAHPETRLRFAVPAGARKLQTEVGLSLGAYENLERDDATDGIQIEVSVLQKNLPDRVLYSRYLNPTQNLEDRGAVLITVAFEMPSEAEIELSVTAGPNGSDRRDWAYLGALTID